MKSLGRSLLAASAAAGLLLGANAASADVKAGVDAWMAGRYDAAVKEWRPLADKGDADAQFNLGQAYKLGRGVPAADLRLAQSWYEKAAQQGHEQAQAVLGLILFQSGNRAAAMPWLKKAADAGDPRAQYVLGTALFNGDLVTKDWPLAYALTLLASDQGLPQASANLEQMNRFMPLQDRQKGMQLAQQKGGAAGAAGTPRQPRVAGAAGRPTGASPNSAIQSPVAAPAPARTAQAPGRPAPAPAPVRTAAAGGGWRVQLGAFGNAAGAQRQWGVLKGKVGPLAGLQPYVVAAGAVTRLQAGPLAGRAAADRVCAAAKAAGSACFPVAP